MHHERNMNKLLIILQPPLLFPIDKNSLPLEPQREPNIIRYGCIPVGVVSQISLHFPHGVFRPAFRVEGVPEQFAVHIILQMLKFGKPPVGTGDVKILFALHLENTGDL